VVAKAAGVLVHPVDAQGDAIAQRLLEVAGRASVGERASLQRELANAVEARLFGDLVHHSAAAAAPEDHRVRSLERLDAIEVVEVAVVLHVVAHAVDEEVGRRAVAAHDHLVAVVLALVQGDPRHVAHDVADAGHQLVLHELAGDHGHRLRHVAQRGRRLGGAVDRRHGVAALGAHRDRVFDRRGLEDEIAHPGLRADSDRSERIDESVHRHPQRIVARGELDREPAVARRDRRRDRMRFVAHRGD
jgi:hypothetical protein